MTDRRGDTTPGYAVLACPHCADYFLTTTHRRQTQTSLQCPHCGQTRQAGTFRCVGRHPEREGAVELRARQLARDAGHGPEYAGVPDSGVLADQLTDDDTPLPQSPPADTPAYNPQWFATQAEAALDRHTADIDTNSSHLGWADDWFAEAAADAGVNHPGATVVDEQVDQRLDDWQEDQPEPPTTGSLSISLDTHIAPTVSLDLSQDNLAPTALQKALFAPDSPLVETLQDALAACATETESPPASALALYEAGVTALDGAYARLAAATIRAESETDDHPLWEFLATTRALGGQTPLQMGSSLDDIERGPVALFAITETIPLVEVTIDTSFFEAKSTRRKRCLTHLIRLTRGVDVRITGSRLALRQFLARHGDELPASVREDAHQRLRSRSSTVTEQRAQSAAAALDDLGADHPAWEVLASLAQTHREMRSYQELYADARFDDVSESGLRRRLKRLRDADLVETPTIDGQHHARLTPVGRVALEKHPTVAIETQTPRSGSIPSSSADWPTEHTGQTQSPDESRPAADVSDPRNLHHSTVLPQRAREGGADGAHSGQADESPSSAPGSSSPQSGPSTDSSPVSVEYLDLESHHAAAAAVSQGQFALVERSLPDTAQGRDHRVPSFSYDPDREEVVVRVDFSPCLALTATRLCAALLSEKALNQVLTPERLAGHPDGMGLDGLEISNPYVLRGAVCVGWLRDVDAEGGRFQTRLEQARQELLAMTDDLSRDVVANDTDADETDADDADDDGTGQIDGEVASDLLRMAHGLMGVALRVYDLLGVDVVRELRFPHGAPAEEELRRDLQEFLAVASSIGGRYGAYSGYRVLHEDRADKRSQLISDPDIDPGQPEGTLLGSWVLTGEGVEEVEPLLEETPEELEVQDEEAHFAPFLLRGRVVDGNRRQAIGEAVTRVLSFKDELRPERQAISVLAGLTGDIFAAAEATMAMGGALQDDREPRALDLQDVRYGVSQLAPEAVVPAVGGSVVSAVIHALVDAQERLSTAEVAELAGCSRRSLSTEANARVFAELEAAGLLEREDQGSGKATLWRVQLPFRVERQDGEPVPEMLVGVDSAPLGSEWRLSDAVCEVLTRATDAYGVDYDFSLGEEVALEAFTGPPSERQLGWFVRSYPEVAGVVSLLEMLLDEDDGVCAGSQPSWMELGVRPDPQQASLSRAVG